MARLGYGVGKLKDDVSARVRAEVARGGYYLNQMIKDSSFRVREAAMLRIA